MLRSARLPSQDKRGHVSPFEDDRVLAILRYREPCDLGAVVDALRAGGIDAIEITADTPGALEADATARGAGARGGGAGGGRRGGGGEDPYRRGGTYVRGRRRLLPGEPGARPADRAGGTGARRAGDPRSAQPDGGAGSGRGGREHREAVPREAGRDRVSRRLAWTVPRRPLHPDRRDRDRRCGSLVGGGRRVRRPRERARRRRGAADAIRSRTDLGRGPACRRPPGGGGGAS